MCIQQKFLSKEVCNLNNFTDFNNAPFYIGAPVMHETRTVKTAVMHETWTVKTAFIDFHWLLAAERYCRNGFLFDRKIRFAIQPRPPQKLSYKSCITQKLFTKTVCNTPH